MRNTSEIDTIYGKEKLKVTCVERKYKIVGPRVTYLITAKKELDENITDRLLHEDMELKTFLTYYEITNIVLPVPSRENINLKRKMPGKMPENVQTKARARRELFDFLDLPEEFTIKDYKKCLEEKGIKITNTAMPYDDMKWFEEKGKVIKTHKNEKNKTVFKKLKKEDTNEIKSEMEIDKTIQSLKNGHKALIGTFRD